MTSTIKYPTHILAFDAAILEELRNNPTLDWSSFVGFAQKHLTIRQRQHLDKHKPTGQEYEGDRRYLQILPYHVFIDTSGAQASGQYADFKIMTYVRGSNGEGESRLLGNVSCGYGGHIEFSDLQVHWDAPDIIDFDDTLRVSSSREIEEETSTYVRPGAMGYPWLMFHDRTNEVGHLHLAMVYLHFLPEDTTVSPKEDMNYINPMTPQQLIDEPRAESWTKHVARAILAGSIQPNKLTFHEYQ